MGRLMSWFADKLFGHVEYEIPAPSTDTRQEATEARLRAEADLARAQGRDPEVRALAASLRKMREVNHFGQRLELAFERRPNQRKG